MNKSESYGNVVLLSTIAKPISSINSRELHSYLEILTMTGEISTVDEGLLAKKYKGLAVHVIPKLIKNKYIKKVPRVEKTTKRKNKFENTYDKEINIAKASHVLTNGGKEAILFQNSERYGYMLKHLQSFLGKLNVLQRQSSQELASALVLCSLLDINFSYNTHPHIANEILYEFPELDNDKSKLEIKKALEKCKSNNPIAYSVNCFLKTADYMDFFLGTQAKVLICDKNEIFPVYVLDNYSTQNPYRSIYAKNEKGILNNYLTTPTTKKSTPYNYPFSKSNGLNGKAIATISSLKNIPNVFDINKKNGFYINEYLEKKEMCRKNIRNLLKLKFESCYLLIRSDKKLKEQYNFIMLNEKEKIKINEMFFNKEEISNNALYLNQYFNLNEYRVAKKIKYELNMSKVPLYKISPTTTFTKEGNPVYFVWDLDIMKIHKAIMDSSSKSKIFCFFDDQVEIISKIIDCYKQNKDSKMGIKTRIIPRKSVEKHLNLA